MNKLFQLYASTVTFFIKIIVQKNIPLNPIFNSKLCRFTCIIFPHGSLVNQFTSINKNSHSIIVKLCEVNILSSELKTSGPPRQFLDMIDLPYLIPPQFILSLTFNLQQ